MPGLVGVIMATEAIKLILNQGEPLIGRVLTYDALAMRFQEFKLHKDEGCPLCGKEKKITEIAFGYEDNSDIISHYEQLNGKNR